MIQVNRIYLIFNRLVTKKFLVDTSEHNYMIIVNLDIMMARRKISLGELAEKIDITPANLSILKTGKAKAIRFSTLEAICKELDCQPGDILEFKEG